MNNSYNYLFDEKGQIRSDRVEDLLVEVISGKYIFTESESPFNLFASRSPTPTEQDAARVVFVRAMKTAQQRGLLLRDDLDNVAINNGLYEPGERDEKTSLQGMLDRQRKAKEKTNDPRQRSQLTMEMEVARKRIIEIDMKEWQVLKHSAEARAEDTRNSYYVANCTFGGDLLDERVWENWPAFLNSARWVLYYDAQVAFHRVSSGLPVHVIRALARTAEWRMRWKSCKESGSNAFEGSMSSWDRNKVNLIYWSDFYDSIYQHPDCPDDLTIQNDEDLQQWVNGQVDKRERQKANASPASGRRGPTYRDGSGKRHVMTKLGADQTIRVGTPYKVRV